MSDEMGFHKQREHQPILSEISVKKKKAPLTVDIPNERGNIVQAKVGDTIAAYCYLWKGIRVGKIEKIKNGFSACGLKITPKANKCLFLHT